MIALELSSFKEFANETLLNKEIDSCLSDFMFKLSALSEMYISGYDLDRGSSHADHPINLYSSKAISIISTNYFYIGGGLPGDNICNLTANSEGRPSRSMHRLLTAIDSLSLYGNKTCTWIAAFQSMPSLSRGWHLDWYDSILVPLSGSKRVLMKSQKASSMSDFYTHSSDYDYGRDNNISEDLSVLVSPGQILKIPAFIPHAVQNSKDEECAAVSLAYDTSFPICQLIPDIYNDLTDGIWAKHPKAALNLCNYRMNTINGEYCGQDRLLRDYPMDALRSMIISDLHRNERFLGKIEI